MWFLIRPIIIRFRKFRANKKGVEYKPLFPKVIERVDEVKLKIKNRKNG
jgi:hypothetical protein